MVPENRAAASIAWSAIAATWPTAVPAGEQPTSLAEFTFDRRDKAAPWYDVSYVNAVSFSITIETTGAKPAPGSNQCETMGCSAPLLRYCPPANLTTRDGKLQRIRRHVPSRELIAAAGTGANYGSTGRRCPVPVERQRRVSQGARRHPWPTCAGRAGGNRNRWTIVPISSSLIF
ncbi:thaumatin family protein [Amycolatopsis jejuensis]|uniref:thaumatin family protein n=1 Tax=Amycolatopsis jejuensis TaxID=330084 RepID=UPI001FDF421D|nr:thaumatin family protein [Amycolatopsis jejuensis]